MPRLTPTQSIQADCEPRNPCWARFSSILIAVRSIVRGVPLFVSARPRTPLRVLCIIAFDTLHRLRNAKRLPVSRIRTLAALLDFGAWANAAFDNKKCSGNECRETLRLLEEAGIRSSAIAYLRRLGALESRRPLPGGDCSRFHEARLYREAVVRLSLGMVAAIAEANPCLDERIRATYRDADLGILFRIAMQCQIIDDVLDYSSDMSAGLPSFLTASKSLPEAFELTRWAAAGYADDRGVPRTTDVFPLRSALFIVSAFAKAVIVLEKFKELDHRPERPFVIGRIRGQTPGPPRTPRQTTSRFPGGSG